MRLKPLVASTIDALTSLSKTKLLVAAISAFSCFFFILFAYFPSDIGRVGKRLGSKLLLLPICFSLFCLFHLLVAIPDIIKIEKKRIKKEKAAKEKIQVSKHT